MSWSASKELSNDVLYVGFNVRHIFCQKSHSIKGWVSVFMFFHDFGSKFNLQQNGHQLKALFMLITMVQIPASYVNPSPRSTKHQWTPNLCLQFSLLFLCRSIPLFRLLWCRETAQRHQQVQRDVRRTLWACTSTAGLCKGPQQKIPPQIETFQELKGMRGVYIPFPCNNMMLVM